MNKNPIIKCIYISKYTPTECELEWDTEPEVEESDFFVYSFITNTDKKDYHNISIPSCIRKLKFTGLKPRTECTFRIDVQDGNDEKIINFVTPPY